MVEANDIDTARKTLGRWRQTELEKKQRRIDALGEENLEDSSGETWHVIADNDDQIE